MTKEIKKITLTEYKFLFALIGFNMTAASILMIVNIFGYGEYYIFFFGLADFCGWLFSWIFLNDRFRQENNMSSVFEAKR